MIFCTQHALGNAQGRTLLPNDLSYDPVYAAAAC